MALSNSNILGIVSNSPRIRTVRSLKQWISDGRLVVGEKLPAKTQLAAKLNVSRSTIRLAIGDLEKEGFITSDRRRRMVLGRGKPNKTFLGDTIVLITDSPEDFAREKIHGTWHSNFIHTGAVDAIRSAGYDILNIHPSRIAGDLIQRLILQQPRGVIIMRRVLQTSSGQHLPQALQEGNVPFVVYGDFGYQHPTDKAVLDTVVSDHEYGAHELTKWLVSKGRRRILRLWTLNVSSPSEKEEWTHQRDVGHEKAMREAGLKPIPALEIYDPNRGGHGEEDFRLGARLMAGYLIDYLTGKDPIDAIMAVSDGVVPIVYGALRLHNCGPGPKVLVVGYDNMWQDQPNRKWEPMPPAATVDKRNLEIGEELMSLLQQRIDGSLPPGDQRRVVKPELIILQDA